MSKLKEMLISFLSTALDAIFCTLGVVFGLLLVFLLFVLLVSAIYMFVGTECIQLPGNGLLCLT